MTSLESRAVKASAALAAIFLFSRPLVAQSDRWVEVASGSSVTVFVDKLSIRREGPRVRVWTKWVHDEELETTAYPSKKYRSTKDLDIYDCVDRTSASLQSIQYAAVDASGEVVDSRSRPEALAQFSELAPETVGEAILTYVCRVSARKRN